MLLGVKIKQPAETLDYDVIYTNWFGGNGDTLASVEVTAPAGIGVTALPPGNEVVKLWVSGGTANESYKLEITATTTEGRVKQDELQIEVREF